MTGSADACLGNPSDCKDFLREIGSDPAEDFVLLGKPGFRHDYNHISTLVHKSASEGHFPMVLDWLQNAKAVLK